MNNVIVVVIISMNRKLMCRCVLVMSVGRMNVLLNMIDCGKFMLFGFFNGLLIMYSSSNCVMYVSMSEMRILLV